MTAREVLTLNEDVPQIVVPQSGDTYVFPRAAHFNAAITDGTNDATAVQSVIDVSIATDDGTGSPVAGTTKTKRVTLYANRVD